VSTQHTPGPWSFAMDRNHARIYLHGLGRPDAVRGSDSLCGYCGEANARLIAAAPELLEACNRLVTYYANETRPEAVFKLDAARAAIERATMEVRR
jgi:hypothetical protein